MLRVVIELKDEKEKVIAEKFKIKCWQQRPKTDMRQTLIAFMKKFNSQSITKK